MAQLDRTVSKGSELKLVARVVDRLSGVKTVTAGLLRDNDGKLEAVDQPAALLPSGQEGVWRASLPTEKVEPGPYVVLLRAVDQVGCAKETTERITIVPPAPRRRRRPRRARSRAACC